VWEPFRSHQMAEQNRDAVHETSDHGMPLPALGIGLRRWTEIGARSKSFDENDRYDWVQQAYDKSLSRQPRMGSDWPHPPEREKRPDDAVPFDLLLVWVSDENVRHHILVENPEVLYDKRLSRLLTLLTLFRWPSAH
jgi:hypothetical protein